MHSLLGIIFHSIGGVAAGSFYVPLTYIKKWAWETYWIINGVFAWVIAPILAVLLTTPEIGWIISSAPDGKVLLTYGMGLLWGMGGLSYGLGIRYLGLSLGNSVALGFCSAFGSLVPSIYYNVFPAEGKTSFTEMISQTGGQVVVLGILLCLMGIAIAGKAGRMKEMEQEAPESSKSTNEFNLKKGLIIAAFSGILSSFFSFGIETGKPLAQAALEAGFDPLYQNNISFMVILWGGFTTNFIWTAYLFIKNRTYKKSSDESTPILQNTILAASAGVIWYLQFFFYGMGESELGSGASSWILHMSVIILTGNLWGVYRKEWTNVGMKTKWVMAAGILAIVASIALVGLGNAL